MITVGGIINNVKTLIDKNGRQMAFIRMEDLYGSFYHLGLGSFSRSSLARANEKTAA